MIEWKSLEQNLEEFNHANYLALRCFRESNSELKWTVMFTRNTKDEIFHLLPLLRISPKYIYEKSSGNFYPVNNNIIDFNSPEKLIDTV